MHESNKDPILDELVKQTELLERIYDAQMSTFVQITRLYDLFAATATGAGEEAVVELLNSHEKGIVDTSVPTIKEFRQSDG